MHIAIHDGFASLASILTSRSLSFVLNPNALNGRVHYVYRD